MITAKQLRRPLRLLLLAGVAITVGLYLKTRHRDEALTLQPNDHSMEPVYYPAETVRARRIDPDFKLTRSRDVLYTFDGKGFVGRVRGLPGDVISSKNGQLYCNADKIGPIKIPAPLPQNPALGEVPEGKLCILNVNPDRKFDDSRNFGLVPRENVQAIILE